MLGLLFIAALSGTVFPLPLSLVPSVQVMLGSTATLLAMRLYGIAWGGLAAMLVGLATIALWHHPFIAAVLLAEVLVVGILLRYRVANLLVADGIFWLFFALPVLWLCFTVVLGENSTTVLPRIFGHALNGMGNAGLATLAFRFLLKRKQRHPTPLLWEHQFNILTACFLFPAVLILLFNTFSIRDLIRQDLEADLVAGCASLEEVLERRNAEIDRALTEVARVASRNHVRPSATLQNKIEQVCRKYPDLKRVYVVDAEGRVVAVAGRNLQLPSETGRIDELVEFQKIQTTLSPIVSEVRTEGSDHSPHVRWYVPISDGKRFDGLVVGNFDVQAFSPLLHEHAPPGALNVALVDREGKVISSSDPLHSPLEDFQQMEAAGPATKGVATFLWQASGNKLLAVFPWKPLPPGGAAKGRSSPWRIAVEVSSGRRLAHLQQVVGLSMAAMLVPALGAFFILPLFSRRLTGPLGRLTEVSRDLPQRVRNGEKIEWPVGSAGEVAALVENFKASETALQSILQELETVKESSEAALDQFMFQQKWDMFSTSRKLEQEIGKRRRIEGLLERIEAAETKYRFLVEKTLVGVYIVQENRLCYVNPRFAEIFGYKPEEIGEGYTLSDLVIHEDKGLVASNVHRQLSGDIDNLRYEFRGWRRDGSVVHVEVLNGQGTYNGALAILGTLIDITERKKAEETVRHMAYHDPLTSLPNRLLFGDRVEQAIALSRRENGMLALMFIDLDRFKTINDTLGHDAGDELLREVAERLRGCVRESDTVSRFGGDEFNLLLTQINCQLDAEMVADKILRTLHWPVTINGQELHGTASIGIAIFPRDGEDAQSLIKNADTALYRAKDLGRNNYQVYHAGMNAQALERMAMENSLYKVLERHELRVYYQPQVSLQTGRIVGMEALLRWQHPQGGMISPATFIPMAEETGLIFPIGEWIMRTACHQAKLWQDASLGPLRLGINVSAQQFQDREFMNVLSSLLNELGYDPRQLNVEITESVVMQDVRENILKLRDLHDFGITVSIDDFGVGYSSLSYLKDFPVDQLKMDRSFVQNLPDNINDANIARHIVNMAHVLGLTVIAEGVETQEQMDFLRSIGCDEVQGYLLSMPLPAEEFDLLLRQGNSFPTLASAPAAVWNAL